MPEPRLYRPACLLRLHVRLEDFGQTDDSGAQDGAAPYSSDKKLQLDQAQVLDATLAQAYAAQSGYSKLTTLGLLKTSASLRQNAAKSSGKSSAGDNGPSDEFSVDFVTSPMELTIEDKGFREADTLEASFPFTDMPLNPLIVREIRVEAWVGTVKSGDFATPENWCLAPVPSKTSVLRFNGYVDLAEMEADESANTVHIKARSYIGTLIDGKINQHAKAYRIGAATKPSLRPVDLGAGNIDLNNRPVIHNPDGSISTVFSMTFGPEDDGTWVLVPGVRFGLNRKMAPKEAYAWYKATGQYLGKFATMEEADVYANSLHEDQAVIYASTPGTNRTSGELLTVYINRILSLYPPTSGDTGGDPFRAYWYASPKEKEPTLDRKTLLRSLQTAKSRNVSGGQDKSTDANAHKDPPAEGSDALGAGDAAVDGSPMMPPKAVTEDGMSIWDLITQACELCGVMPMYKPSLPPFVNPEFSAFSTFTAGAAGLATQTMIDPVNCLLVTPPEAFYDDITSAVQIKGGARDGFSRDFGYNSGGGTFTSDVRFMVWGHNLAKMKLARHMGKVRPTAVEVRAYNPDASDTLRVMSSRFPKHNPKKPKGQGRSAHKMTEKGGGKIDVIRTFVLKGIRDQKALDRAAVSLYHQLTHAELTMGLETDELASYIDPVASAAAGALVENHNESPDILRLCAGSPVHVTVAKKSTDSADLTICSLSEFYDLKGDQIVDLLTKQNDRWGTFRTDGSLDTNKLLDTAQKIQAAYRAAKLPTVYYCKGIRLQFKADDEFFHCSMELANYMPSNDPANMDQDNQAMNDVRKKKPLSARAKALSAEQQRTASIEDQALRQGLA